jgi:chemotaxis family two-component system sensor kinase Cph1
MMDLTDCDREPIHIPGAIQPFGVLFVLAEPSLTVTQVSENVHDHLDVGVEEVLGQPLANLLDAPSIAAVRGALAEERWHDLNPLPIDARGKPFDGIVHRHEGAAILELEPNPGTPMTTYHPFRPALIRLQRVVTSAELGEVIVEQMRRVTGFERVLLYRFHEDGHGSVDAEAKEPELEPYLGLHYPASDIPAQARELYRKKWLRLIFDARVKPVRVVPTLRADTGGPLDLTFSVLRSVSPIHLEYMANMGVRASMSISLVVRDRLWGLVSCLNHTSPRRVSQEMRMACEFLGRLASLQIAAFEDRDQLAQRRSRRAIEEDLARAMRESAAEVNVLEALLTRPKELLGIVSADGVAVMSGGEIMTSGHTPPPALIQDIAAWVEQKEGFRPFATASLGGVFPPAREHSDVASGLLTFALPGAPPRRLLWFRPELIETVSWAGDPNKPVAASSGDRLRPRHSFALWREEVRLRSHPWTASNLEAADELQRRAIEVDLQRRFLSEQRAVQARDDVLAVVSHDLRSPLSTILLQTEVLLRPSPAEDEGRAHVVRDNAERIRRSAARMRALTDDLLDLASLEARRFALRLQSVESRDLLEEALLAASPLAEAKRITLAVELIETPKLEADAERILRVLSNLLGNAIKFTPDGGKIDVRAERRGDDLLIAVADTGPGIPADDLPHIFERYWRATGSSKPGSGLGLYIASGIIEAHGGKIWAESSAGGARFTFALPLARPPSERTLPDRPVRSSEREPSEDR